MCHSSVRAIYNGLRYTNRWHKHKSTDNNGAKLTHHFFHRPCSAHSSLASPAPRVCARVCVLMCLPSRPFIRIESRTRVSLWNINQISIRFMFDSGHFFSFVFRTYVRQDIEANILYLIKLFKQPRQAASMRSKMANVLVWDEVNTNLRSHFVQAHTHTRARRTAK